MKIIKKLIKIVSWFFVGIFSLLIVVCIYHHISNLFEKNTNIPGDKIKVYENEYIHSFRLGEGEYTIVLLPGMGTPSPYYDFYELANELAKSNQVIIIEPLGYGFSDNTSKDRFLADYEYELSKVLDFYDVKNNIILLGHSYSGLSNLNYANKHSEVKGIVCLDCTTAYQIDTHVKDGEFIEEPPKASLIYSIVSPLGLTRLFYTTFMSKEINEELLMDIKLEHQKDYKHLMYNKTLNKTIINETNDIYYNQLDLLYDKYREDLHAITFLSSETITEMKEYKKNGDFNQDWEEMHNLLISNENNQKIEVLNGNHYIHHGNVFSISNKINEMINKIDKY